MTLTFEPIRDIIKVNASTKFRVCMSNGSAVRALTNRQTDTHTQTGPILYPGPLTREGMKSTCIMAFWHPGLSTQSCFISFKKMPSYNCLDGVKGPLLLCTNHTNNEKHMHHDFLAPGPIYILRKFPPINLEKSNHILTQGKYGCCLYYDHVESSLE